MVDQQQSNVEAEVTFLPDKKKKEALTKKPASDNTRNQKGESGYDTKLNLKGKDKEPYITRTIKIPKGTKDPQQYVKDRAKEIAAETGAKVKVIGEEEDDGQSSSGGGADTGQGSTPTTGTQGGEPGAQTSQNQPQQTPAQQARNPGSTGTNPNAYPSNYNVLQQLMQTNTMQTAAASAQSASLQEIAQRNQGSLGAMRAPMTNSQGQTLYRQPYTVKSTDVDNRVIRTIAREAGSNIAGVDAVINVLINRANSSGYPGSDSLLGQVSAPGQWEGYNQGNPTPAQAQYIRERIYAIASGTVADITGGANEFRGSEYYNKNTAATSGFVRNSLRGYNNVGNNIFIRNYGYRSNIWAGGPYASYPIK